MTNRPPTGERAVSVSLNYVLGLSIAFLLMVGLLFVGSDFVNEQRETSIRTELEVLGEQVASDISMTDRLVRTTDGSGTVEVSRSLPDRVSGNSYRISIQGSTDPYLVVETDNPDVSVRVDFSTETPVELDRTTGGAIVIEYTSGTISVEAA